MSEIVKLQVSEKIIGPSIFSASSLLRIPIESEFNVTKGLVVLILLMIMPLIWNCA